MDRLNRMNLPDWGTVDLIDYTISFCGGGASFVYMFEEIFAKASYSFHSDTDRPLIFDCGSNIGMSVLFFKKLYPTARITAFEPDPRILTPPIKDWSLSTLKDKLIKIGAKVVSHDCYVIFQMADVAIARQMFQEILRLIAELPPHPPPAPA